MLWRDVKEFIIGNPLTTEGLAHERITKIKALAVLSSDALSSVAYAADEILLVLVLAGLGAITFMPGIVIAIVALLSIVTISYQQSIVAYPTGGGAYIVGKENIGVVSGLVAGAALMIGYVLTVAVSVAAGVDAITSALPTLTGWNVTIANVLILIVMFINLRGVQESASIFAIPTYSFIVLMYLMIAVGVVEWIMGYGPTNTGFPPSEAPPVMESLSLFLILRAFSSGCSALTGVEAISNSVPAFYPPEARNANRTMAAMALVLGSMFVGVALLTVHFQNLPNGQETIVSQLAHDIFGNGFLYYSIQAATALILVLAANTSYTGFPRLASLMAKDGFLPRQLMMMGDRLVFSNGILILSALSVALIVLFGGDTHALIPLYAVGVFLSFTIAQFGMVRFWLRNRNPNWHYRATANAIGGIATALVTLIIGLTKFTQGAWIVILLVPAIVAWLMVIRRHYDAMRAALTLTKVPELSPMRQKVVLLVSGVHKGVINAIRYAKTIAQDGDACAIYVSLDLEGTKRMKENWELWDTGIPLVVIDSPYRSILHPVIMYLEYLEMQGNYTSITVVLPEFVVKRWWQQVLHNQTALTIKWALLFRKRIIVISVPHHLDI